MELNFNFDDKIITFCKQDQFRSYVRQAINDELFFKDILAKLNMNDTIDTKLDKKIPKQVKNELDKILPAMVETKVESKVPKQVKNELDRILPALVEAKILQYITNQFPAQVMKEISTQLPNYLNNNYAMQQLLNNHQNDLSYALEEKAREIINKIVNDPQYHVITSAHLAAIDEKCNQKINEIQSNASQQLFNNHNNFTTQLSDNSNKFSSQLRDMKTAVDVDMANLKQGLNNINQLYNRISMLEAKNTNLESDTSFLKWITSCIGVIALGTIGVIEYMRR